MAAKPSTLPRWANVGGAIVVPSSAKQDIGHVAGERPPAQYENWAKNLAYQWFSYLNDGALSGNHTIAGTLGVSGLITATAGLTAAANQHVTVSGTGDYKHGDRTAQVDLFRGSYGTGGSYFQAFSSNVVRTRLTGSTGLANVYIPLVDHLRVGDRVKSIQLVGTGADVTASFYKVTSAGGTPTATPVPSTLTSGGMSTVGFQIHTVTTPVAIAAGERWQLRIVNGSGDVDFFFGQITWDRP